MDEIIYNFDLCEYGVEICDSCDQKCIIFKDIIKCEGDEDETEI